MSVRKHETRVVYSCGHKAHVTLYGKSEEQERKRKWCEEKGLCPSCYAEQMKQDRAVLLAMRKDEYCLPDLEGSPKQTAWAEKTEIPALTCWSVTSQKVTPELPSRAPTKPISLFSTGTKG